MMIPLLRLSILFLMIYEKEFRDGWTGWRNGGLLMSACLII